MLHVTRVMITGLLATGCAMQATPIPVEGDIQALVGEWAGEYRSPGVDRAGSILFTLRAGSDTAAGDILMVPANAGAPELSESDPSYRPPQLLYVSFVRCEASQVTGWMKPYRDPDTGETRRTTFDGTISGDTIEGTFISYADESGRRLTGTWKVKRKQDR